MTPRIGSLFTGYGGLDMAVETITGGKTAWVSDIDPGANKILAHHHPDIPNLGDISAIDWSTIEPVDVLTGGFPCQDVSAAGKRAGLVRYGDSNRSGLWAEMARAIDILRPRLVVAENVRGLLSAKADAHPDVFDCLACMAHTLDEPMRALGAVLGDLAALGYDAAWHGVRASDVGAPHQRFRVFVIAWPADTDIAGLERHWRLRHPSGQVQASAHDRAPDSGGVTLLGTPRGSSANGVGQYNDSPRGTRGRLEAQVDQLLKTPTAQLAVNGGSQHPDKRREGGHGPTLADEIEHLPTPRGTDGYKGGPNMRGSSGDLMMPSAVLRTDWDVYGAAIGRWERITRPAPPPTELSTRNAQRLSPAFVEWMMGLPLGHVTDPAIGLTRNEQLKALGNGVVPQQAEHALRYLLSVVGADVA